MRDWTTLLALIPENLDTEAGEIPATKGAVILVRDVRSPPLGHVDDDGEVPAGWQAGSVSPTPKVARQLAANFGKRPSVPGQDGARVYLARVEAKVDWSTEAPVLGALVRAAQVGAWGAPEAILIWLPFDAAAEAALAKVWPETPVLFVDSPEAVRAVVQALWPPGVKQ